ncbi:hypothetical protein [Actinomadura atramentaria]|uniref:hypothetical protein n=1 Tax=Actinomadura atramentaria TaxID=1990 RepID=UPI000373B6E2|nr:hypothetical protein [Actinomadura atramentaria]
MSARTLAGPGTRCDPARPADAVLATRAGPLRAGAADVAACLPAVTPWDLPHIARAERAFVAAELTALLALWLEGARRVVNRPAGGVLCGRGLEADDVRWAARAAGLPVLDRPARDAVRLTLVGDRLLPAGTGATADAGAGELVRALAAALGAEVLCARVACGSGGWAVSAVEPWWRAADRATAEAVAALLARGTR